MKLNNISCAVQGSNTGFGDCILQIANITGAFLIPKGKTFTAAEILDFEATLIAAASADLPANRIYPIHGFEQITDGTEDKTVQTLGYGGKYPVREGDYDWTFQFVQGGFCLLKSLRAFNGTGKDFLFYDADGKIYGRKSGDELGGIPPVFFWANPWKANDGSNATINTVQFVFKPRYVNEDLGFVQSDFNPADIQGLQTVNLSNAAARAANVLKISAKTGCSGYDLYELYSVDLAAVGNWVAKNAAGGVITITSVAVDANLSAWTITLDAADPEYDADEPVVISLAAPSVLSADGVTGYESKALTIA